jgi:hypothetical protein
VGVDNRSEWSPIKYRDVHVPGPAMELLVVCSVGNGVHIAGSAAAKPSPPLPLPNSENITAGLWWI